MRIAKALGLVLLLAGAGAGQTFDVASVKVASPLAAGGGGARPTGSGSGVSDPSRFERKSVTLASLIMQAYGVKSYQVSGPAWLTTERYDVMAKLPEGSTREDQPAMLQNLLAERFQLKVHREKKESRVYNLVVAQGGPKLHEYVVPAEGAPPAREGLSMMMSSGGQVNTATLHDHMTMDRLTLILAGNVEYPVFDKTGLTGTYQLDLKWVGENRSPALSDAASEPGASIFAALESQLGLKLEPTKGMVEMVVVDHAEKVPTGN